jgi:hypothetical protein
MRSGPVVRHRMGEWIFPQGNGQRPKEDADAKEGPEMRRDGGRWASHTSQKRNELRWSKGSPLALSPLHSPALICVASRPSSRVYPGRDFRIPPPYHMQRLSTHRRARPFPYGSLDATA